MKNEKQNTRLPMNVKLIIIKNVAKARVIYLLSWFIAYDGIDDWMAEWLMCLLGSCAVHSMCRIRRLIQF